MKKILLLTAALTFTFVSCNNDDDDEGNNTIAPATYSFERDGVSTVSYDGQTTRILMGEEFIDELKNSSATLAELNGMFAHSEGDDDFSDPDLNASSKSIRSKTAASTDYFSTNTTEAQSIKAQFDTWISEQVNDVFPNWNNDASAGVAGGIQESGGGSTRYVNAKGVELNQVINKGLIGGLMADQMLNNYLSPAVLDAGDNVTNNDNAIVEDGKSYTTMEHKWDEAFGYLYGTDDAENPQLGADSFLNKYLARVDGDDDFTGIAQDVYDALKLGRAAIVNYDYTTRDAQAEIIREKISEVIAIRAVYYLQQAKSSLGTDMAAAFHDLSEGLGFVYSLRFTREPNTDMSYFSLQEVEDIIDSLMVDDGLWDVDATTLDSISEDIADRFNFTVDQAAN